MAGDANYADVSLLLKADGANGSTTIVDSSPTPKVVTAVGGAQISTAQSKFGGSSIYFDGTGDYLRLTDSADWFFGSAAFTIECWAKRSSASGSYTLTAQISGAYFGHQFILTGTGATFNSYNTSITSLTAAFTPDTSWHHVAACSDGTTLRIFLDGAIVGSRAATNIPDSTGFLYVGIDWDGASTPFNGYIDDLRITKGVARYTAAFTPPTAAFAAGLGQVSGVIRDSANALCSRTVRAYRRDTGALAGSAVSDAGTGAYSIDCPTLDEVSVIALDSAVSGTFYNDQVARVIPA